VIAWLRMSLPLTQEYSRLKELAAAGVGDAGVTTLVIEMAVRARQLLGSCERVRLTSAVRDKNYFGFQRDAHSRPINEALYIQDSDQLEEMLSGFRSNLPDMTRENLTKTTYTIASSVFAIHDVSGVGRKASATFFEILIGNIVSRAIGISPRKKVRIPESEAELPTDYIFDPGERSRKLHLPIKTSTREKAVQAWVHQLVLDRIFGHNVYRGVLVISSETKRNASTGLVTEICIPRQLQMFQAHVAELTRIYYLDPPEAYLGLGTTFPRVEVKTFGERQRI